MESKYGNLLENLIYPLILIALMWLIALVQLLFEADFYWLGVYPRTFEGIRGILFAPFVHSGFSHLISNSVPFLVAGTVIVSIFRSVAFRAYNLMHFFTGLMVWVFARNWEDNHAIFHIGASGVVYAMVSFIFFCGIFVRNRISIAIALVMVILYSGMIQGISPYQEGISWESHLFGLIVGAGVAVFFRDEIKEEHRAKQWEGVETEELPKEHFLPRDVFDKTKYDD